MIPVEKYEAIKNKISSEKGPFALFGLFLRDDAPDKWDLLVTAPWILSEKTSALRYLSEEIQKALTSEELIALSRIVILEPGNPVLEAILSAFNITNSRSEFKNCNFNGLQVKHAYIFEASRHLLETAPAR